MGTIDKELMEVFAKEVFRLNKWEYTPKQLEEKATVIDQWKKKYLETDLLRQLNITVGNKGKSHKLDIIKLMNLCKDAEEFENAFNKKYGKDDLSHIKGIAPEDKAENPITFDQFIQGTFKPSKKRK